MTQIPATADPAALNGDAGPRACLDGCDAAQPGQWFGTDEAAARAYLARCVSRAAGASPGSSGPDEAVAITPRWNPRRSSALSLVRGLIREAVTAGAITCPRGHGLTLVTVSGDGWSAYQWVVAFPPGADFWVSSPCTQDPSCIGDGSRGADGALAILREAVKSGNAMLRACRAQAAAPENADAALALLTQPGLVTWPERGPALVNDAGPIRPGRAPERLPVYLQPTLVTLTTGGPKSARGHAEVEFAFTEGARLVMYAGRIPQDILFRMLHTPGLLQRRVLA